jgi:hypothetical protein
MMRFPPVLLAAVLLACGKAADSNQPQPMSAEAALADAAGAKALPREHFVSATGGFDLDLPGVWTGRYRTEEMKDTTTHARLAVVFRYLPDSGSKAPSHPLITLRIFGRAEWTAATLPGSPSIGSVLAERGNDVFVLSLPRDNPYPSGSPEATEFDRLIISLAQGGKQVDLTPHPAP